MRAIKIPNTALLDVYGRPVAVNSHDLHRPSVISNHSYRDHPEKNPANNHLDIREKNSTVTASLSKSDHTEQLTVIGK